MSNPQVSKAMELFQQFITDNADAFMGIAVCFGAGDPDTQDVATIHGGINRDHPIYDRIVMRIIRNIEVGRDEMYSMESAEEDLLGVKHGDATH